ncbi:MAG: hypothetical protein KKG00_04975 [Bacteroidetes bacterium]|nr:hypothetical protein [Bacteroidota bacterium]
MKKYQSFLGENRMIKDQGLLRHEDIRKKIKILPELKELIPPLQADEFAQLEANIIKEGCREALLIWEVSKSEELVEKNEYVLIDGHNRHRICTKHGLDFRIHLVSFPGLTEVKEYMIDNQLGRRNLSPEQISYLRGKKYNAQKLDKGKYERSGHKGQSDPYESGKSTADRLAEQFNVSQKTIKRDAVFAEGLDKLSSEQRKEVLSGKSKLRKSDIQALGRGGVGVPPSVSARARPTMEENESGKAESDRQKLIAKISTLSSQLSDRKKATARLCDQLITAAQELKKMEGTK